MVERARVPAGSPEGGQYAPMGQSMRSQAAAAGENAEVATITDLEGREITERTLGLDETVERPKFPRMYDPKEQLVHHHTHPFDAPPSLGDVLNASNSPGVKKSVVHSPEAMYEMEILNHDKVYQAARDVAGEIHIRETDKFLETGIKRERKQRVREENTELLDRLQDMGLLKWKRIM